MPGIYGNHLPQMQAALEDLTGRIDGIREEMKRTLGMDPVEHCLGRIKSEESMR